MNDFYNLLNHLMELAPMQRVAVSAIPMIFAITVHEAAHGYIAKQFGDNTAYDLGRISVNPLKHIDPLGTIVIPSLTMFFGGMFFGWAKPVPVNFGRLKHPKKDMLWVAAAGPGANFLMMVLWVISLKFSFLLPEMYVQPFELMCASGILTNIVLMVLNLIPIPPLDGGRIAVSLLPYKAALRYARVERYGFIILIVLLFTHILDKIMWPFVMLTIQAIVSVFF